MAGPWEKYGGAKEGPWSKYAAKPAAPETEGPSVIGDVAAAGASGAARGVADLIGLPGTIGDAGRSGLEWMLRRGYQAVTGSEPSPQGGMVERFFAGPTPEVEAQLIGGGSSPIGGENLKAAMSAATGGATDFQPKTTAGEYARTVGEFLPGVIAPGGVARKVVGNVLAPALASETAGQMTEGSALEPYARIVGALAGGVAGNIGAGRKAAQMPSARQILDEGGDAFEAAKPVLKDTQLTNQAYREVVDALQGTADDFGLVPEVHSPTMRLLRRHDKAAGHFDPGGSVDDAARMSTDDALAKLSKSGARQERRVLNQIAPSAGRKPAAPMSLSEFVAAKGGVIDFKGEAAAVAGGAKTKFGRVVRDDGKRSLDAMREAAEEAGYLADYTTDEFGRASVDDFLRALDDDLRGTKVFSRENLDRAAEIDAFEAQQSMRSDMRSNLDQIGQDLPGSVSDDVVGRAAQLMDAERIGPQEALRRAIADDIAENGIMPQEVPAGLFPDPQNPGAPMGGAEPSLFDLEMARRGLGHIGRGNVMNRSQGALTGRLTDKLDESVEALMGRPEAFKASKATDADQALQTLAKARETWRTGLKSQIIENAIEQAGNVASGFENGLRIEFRKLLKGKAARNFNATELEAIKRVANGTVTQNALRWLGGFGVPVDSGRNFLGSVIGSGAGHALGGPLGAIGLPAVGSAAKMGASSVAARNAEIVDALVKSGKKGADLYRNALAAQKTAGRAAILRALLQGQSAGRIPSERAGAQ